MVSIVGSSSLPRSAAGGGTSVPSHDRPLLFDRWSRIDLREPGKSSPIMTDAPNVTTALNTRKPCFKAAQWQPDRVSTCHYQIRRKALTKKHLSGVLSTGNPLTLSTKRAIERQRDRRTQKEVTHRRRGANWTVMSPSDMLRPAKDGRRRSGNSDGSLTATQDKLHERIRTILPAYAFTGATRPPSAAKSPCGSY